MNYYRRYVGDYLRDTSRLSMLEHGAYNLLLDYYYADEKPLPNDRDEIYTMVRAMTAADRKAVDKILARYFRLEADGLHNARADEEIGIAITVIETARDNGKLGGRPKKNRGETQTITQTETQTETGGLTKNITQTITEGITQTEPANNHPPTTNHQPPAPNHQPPRTNGAQKPGALALLADVPPQLVADWLSVRKAKRSPPPTETAVADLRREAEKAGISVEEAVRICCVRSWVGFNSAWDWRTSSPSQQAEAANRLPI